LVTALQEARLALKELAAHHSGVFSDDAPEFNEGGIGYEAIAKATRVLEGATSDATRVCDDCNSTDHIEGSERCAVSYPPKNVHDIKEGDAVISETDQSGICSKGAPGRVSEYPYADNPELALVEFDSPEFEQNYGVFYLVELTKVE
jgi:hypothetical protein